MNKIIVTGAAGFIGYSLCNKLLARGDSIIGIDNHNLLKPNPKRNAFGPFK